MPTGAEFVTNPYLREDPSKKRQSPPVEVSLLEGDVLLASLALGGVALGSAAFRSCLLPGNERAEETQLILSVTTELLGLLLVP